MISAADFEDLFPHLFGPNADKKDKPLPASLQLVDDAAVPVHKGPAPRLLPEEQRELAEI